MSDPHEPYTLLLIILMKQYELVTVIDANLSGKEMKEVSASVEKLLGKKILDTDEIGLLPTAYPIQGQDQAYYVSYHVEMESDDIDQLKKDMSILKWLAKYTIFGLRSHEKFFKMADLKKRVEDLMPEEEEVVEEIEEKEESVDNSSEL